MNSSIFYGGVVKLISTQELNITAVFEKKDTRPQIVHSHKGIDHALCLLSAKISDDNASAKEADIKWLYPKIKHEQTSFERLLTRCYMEINFSEHSVQIKTTEASAEVFNQYPGVYHRCIVKPTLQEAMENLLAIQPSLEIPKGTPCTYCSELATERDGMGVALCGIPGNHS